MKAQSLEMIVICLGEINNNKIADINEHPLCARHCSWACPALFYSQVLLQGRTLSLGVVGEWWADLLSMVQGTEGWNLEGCERKVCRVIGSHGGCQSREGTTAGEWAHWVFVEERSALWEALGTPR